MKRFWKEDLDGFAGLEYLKLKQVPMRYSKKGGVIDLKPMALERLVARALIAGRNPLRGSEVKFLRTTAGLSLDKFARRLGLTSGAIFHWEKTPHVRLLPVNEVAVRSLCADEYGVDVSGRFSQLLGGAMEPIVVEITGLRRKGHRLNTND